MGYLNFMKIKILASDSMGVRSMATFIETKDRKILIDPGSALSPIRYGLPPSQIEIEELNKRWTIIKRFANKAKILIVSHYHYDHYDPEEPELYHNKTVFVKHPTDHINKSQMKRSKYFLDEIKSFAKEIIYSDCNTMKFGDTTLLFSNPVPHGPSNRLGYVVETYVRDEKDSFIHTSDVEGPALDEQINFILENKPKTVFLDGPLSYIIYRYGNKNLKRALNNMKKILDGDTETLIYDHHFLRDKNYSKIISDVKHYGDMLGKKVLTGAEFMGEKNRPLELMRRELHKE